MKAAKILMLALLSSFSTVTACASAAKDYAEAEDRIDAASVRLTGMRTKELSVALSRDWAGKKKEDLVFWIGSLPKEAGVTWLTQKADPDAVVLRISTEYPARSELSAVFRFWLSSVGIVERVQHYHDQTAKEGTRWGRAL